MSTINGKACVANGRNLLPGTNQGLANWTFGAGTGGSHEKYAFDVQNGQGMTMTTTVAYTNYFWLGYKLNYQVLKQNTDYVLSFWAKSTDIDRTITARFTNGSGGNMVAYFGNVSLKSGVKTKVVLRATTNDVEFTDQYLYLNSFVMLGGIDIWDLKIETGTVATPYSPAPVDKVFSNGRQVYGRNLVSGTSTQVVQANDWNLHVADIDYDKSLGSNLCASVMINNADHASDLAQGNAYIIIQTIDQSGNVLATASGHGVSYNADGLSWCSTTIDDNISSVRVIIRTNNMSRNAFYSCLKIEKGTTPTPWSPAPEDVM